MKEEFGSSKNKGLIATIFALLIVGFLLGFIDNGPNHKPKIFLLKNKIVQGPNE